MACQEMEGSPARAARDIQGRRLFVAVVAGSPRRVVIVSVPSRPPCSCFLPTCNNPRIFGDALSRAVAELAAEHAKAKYTWRRGKPA